MSRNAKFMVLKNLKLMKARIISVELTGLAFTLF
jgi:hypothetical protein